MTSTTYLSPRNSSVMVDRNWAASLGLNQVPGARRVGSFYRLPRVAYLRALQAQSDADSQVFEIPSTQAAEVIAAAEQITQAAAEQGATSGRRSLSPCMGAAGKDSGSRRTARVKTPA